MQAKVICNSQHKGIIVMEKNKKKWKLEYLESLPQQDFDKQEINEEST